MEYKQRNHRNESFCQNDMVLLAKSTISKMPRLFAKNTLFVLQSNRNIVGLNFQLFNGGNDIS